MKWLVRIAAGVTIGLLLHGAFLSSGSGTGKAWGLLVVAVIGFVAWFEARDRRRFEEDVRDRFLGDDDDRRGGPPGYA